jgi:hypothetical protein
MLPLLSIVLLTPLVYLPWIPPCLLAMKKVSANIGGSVRKQR